MFIKSVHQRIQRNWSKDLNLLKIDKIILDRCYWNYICLLILEARSLLCMVILSCGRDETLDRLWNNVTVDRSKGTFPQVIIFSSAVLILLTFSRYSLDDVLLISKQQPLGLVQALRAALSSDDKREVVRYAYSWWLLLWAAISVACFFLWT